MIPKMIQRALQLNLGRFKEVSKPSTGLVQCEKGAIFSAADNVKMRAQYGGLTVADSLLSASLLFPPGQHCTQIHTDFLGPITNTETSTYSVQMLRESRSFSHCQVDITQDGTLRNRSLALAHTTEHSSESLFSQVLMGDVLTPDQLASDTEQLEQLRTDTPAARFRYAERTLYFTAALGVKVWPLNRDVYFRHNVEPADVFQFWMKMDWNEETLANMRQSYSEEAVAQAALAYISDFRIMGSALRLQPAFRDGMTTTLSHTLYFHRPLAPSLAANDPLLHSSSCYSAHNNTATVRVHFFNPGGELLATAVQLALVRPERPAAL